MISIEIKGLSKSFGSLDAVNDLSFSVHSGRITGFLGPNGSGKTTTLRAIVNLVRPSAGEALIGGRRYDQLEQPRRHVGALLDSSGFHPGRRGRDHLRIMARCADVDLNRVDEVLDEVGLTADGGRRVGDYSLGMRQRLGLASALIGDPDVLILDEPANGLDPAGIAWLRDLLVKRASAGRTVIISSHVLSEVAQIITDVVIINNGRLAYAGPAGDLADETSLEAAFLRLTSSAGTGATATVPDGASS